MQRGDLAAEGLDLDLDPGHLGGEVRDELLALGRIDLLLAGRRKKLLQLSSHEVHERWGHGHGGIGRCLPMGQALRDRLQIRRRLLLRLQQSSQGL